MRKVYSLVAVFAFMAVIFGLVLTDLFIVLSSLYSSSSAPISMRHHQYNVYVCMFAYYIQAQVLCMYNMLSFKHVCCNYVSIVPYLRKHTEKIREYCIVLYCHHIFTTFFISDVIGLILISVFIVFLISLCNTNLHCAHLLYHVHCTPHQPFFLVPSPSPLSSI